jgi:hypothetical protein
MELSPLINSLKQNLKSTTAPAGEDIAEAVGLLTRSIEPAARLCFLEAMSEAADEITLALDDTTVEARLRGQDVEFVVSDSTPVEIEPSPTSAAETPASEDVARITLRLPESIKDSVEQAAKSENLSVNGWLVSAIATAVDTGSSTSHKPHHGRRNRSYRGFARS